MFYLSKILPPFGLPVGVTLILLLSGILFRRRWLLVTAAAVLWLSSIPLVGAWLGRATEEWTERIPARDALVVDAIVVLSAGRVVAPGRAAISEWTDPDRFFAGVELFQAGKAPLLVFTGAWLPWEPDAPLEGEVLAGYARALGVPANGIRVTGRVSNTAEEARAVAQVLGVQHARQARVLLVTSAFHMSRARRLFENAGLAVTTFPVDFAHSDAGGVGVMDFLPSAGALMQTQTAMREMYGRLYYRVRSF